MFLLRCHEWLTSIKRVDLQHEDPEHLHEKRICADHFKDWCFSSTERKRLISSAVPLSTHVLLENCPPPKKVKTTKCDIQASENSGKLNSSPVLQYPECDVSISTKSQVCVDPTCRKKYNDKESKEIESSPKSSLIRRLRVKICRMKKKLQSTTSLLARKKDLLEHLKDMLPMKLYLFIKSQLMLTGKPLHGRRWTLKDKSIALSIYLRSPAAYRALSKILFLPCKKTLVRSISSMARRPGFCPVLLGTIKIISGKLSMREKLCVLCLDEMYIRKHLSYNKKYDLIEGYENYGCSVQHKEEPKLADNALVFMVRGLCVNWKQPIGYFFSSRGTPASVLKVLLLEACTKLAEAGLSLVAVICDQGIPNQRLYTELNVSPSQPYFECSGREIFTLHDPPHLLKSVRNNLQKYKIVFGDKKEKSASWNYVRELYNVDSKLKYRMCPKLSQTHVEVTGLKKMKVSLAAQVFSHSVSAGICCLTALGRLPSEAAYTADFCSQMDELWDSLNSCSLHHAKELARGVTEKSKHVNFWQEKCDWINSWTFVKRDGSTFTPPCKRGWILTLSAVVQLWKEYQKDGLNFMLTRRLNQDCLENTFSSIRRKGGNNDNPDCMQFQFAMRAVVAYNLLSRSELTNCESDSDLLLAAMCPTKCRELSSLMTHPSESSEYNKEHRNLMESLNQNILSDIPSINDCDTYLLDQITMTYIAGYLAKKSAEKVGGCSSCLQLLTGSQEELEARGLLIGFKEYSKCTLIYPTLNLLQTVERFNAKADSLANVVFKQEYVAKNLYRSLSEIDVNWLNANTCHNVKHYIIGIFIKIYIYKFIRKVNASVKSKSLNAR